MPPAFAILAAAIEMIDNTSVSAEQQSIAGDGHYHRRRRAAILREWPEVRDLFGPCPSTALLALPIVLAQFLLAWAASEAPWWLVLGLAYGVGAFLAHFLNVVIHECSHNLAFRSTAWNKLLAITVNLPGVLPSALPFRHYHLLHHRFLGQTGLDADVPAPWAIALVGRRRIGKIVWLLAQPLTYSVINPLGVRRRLPLDIWLATNLLVVIAADLAVAIWLGPGAVAYLGLSIYLAVGPHPTGAHILQEHINFEGREETSSYYGPINAISINHGFHVEHHDFPNVAGPRLARLRRIARQHYAGRFHHRSRIATLWRFITDRHIALDSRVIRRA
jgi:sphingolipid 4-desaturase/C4-monooxygenase